MFKLTTKWVFPILAFSFVLVFLLIVQPVLAEGDSPVAGPPDGGALPAAPPDGAAVLPLTTEEGTDAGIVTAPAQSMSAIQIQAAGDAWYFCIGAGCTGGKRTHSGVGAVSNAVSNFATDKGAGLINVGGAYTFTGGITIDNIAGLTGLVRDPISTGVPLLNSYLYILNMTKGFRLEGINLSGTYGGGNDATPMLKFEDTAGLLKIIDVDVKNNGSGMMIYNHNGAIEILRTDVSQTTSNVLKIESECCVSNVKITNSSFNDNNGWYTLKIITMGSATLNGVAAINNGGPGGVIFAANGVTIKNSVFNNNKDNGSGREWRGFGVYLIGDYDRDPPFSDTVYIKGPVVLDNMVAMGNARGGILLATSGNVTLSNSRIDQNGWGAMIDTCFLDGTTNCTYAGTGIVTITNTIFKWNNDDALELIANGMITLTKLEVSDTTGGIGASINNAKIVTGSKPVFINQSSFHDNNDYGLNVLSKGPITINGVDASNNRTTGYGATLDNSGGLGGVTLLTTLGENTFNENKGHGLYIHTNGAITLNNIEVISNDAGGAKLENYSGILPVMINGAEINENTGGAGLIIDTSGNITLQHIEASGNSGIGAHLDTCSWTPDVCNNPAARSVMVMDGQFSGNGIGGNADGVEVFTKGPITFNVVEANSNSHAGAVLRNLYGTAPVTLLGVLGTNYFSGNNDGAGLEIRSKGAVTLNWVDSGGNSDQCIFIDNNAGTGNVIMNNIATGGCDFWNVDVLSSGSITITNIQADESQNSGGARLINTSATSPKPVNIANGDFSGNFGDGLFVESKGMISVFHFRAAGNDDGFASLGVHLSNQFTGAIAGVTLNSIPGEWSLVEDNYSTGVIINTNGPVTITNLVSNANGNGTHTKGIELVNLIGNVTLTNIELEDNAGTGVNVVTTGSISLTNIQGYNNGAIGADLWNNGATTPKPVTLNKTGFDESHTDVGIRVWSKGMITLNNVWADGTDFGVLPSSSGTGAVLKNDYPGAVAGITILGSLGENHFCGNDQLGLQISSNGPITLNKIYACENKGTAGTPKGGAVLVNTGGTANVIINASHFDGNTGGGAAGLYVETNGSITWIGGSADNNTAMGAFLQNETGTNKPVILTGVSFSGGEGTGLQVHSAGMVTLTNLYVHENKGIGAFIKNDWGSGNVILLGLSNTVDGNQLRGLVIESTGLVTVNNLNASYNSDDGLWIDTTGAVTISNIKAYYNGDNGIHVENHAAITLTNAYGFMNGMGGNLDGVNLISHDHPITITNGAFHGNGRYGILANAGAGFNVTLTNVTYFGNDRFSDFVTNGDINIVGTLIIH